jgi:ribonuclease P protein component
VERNRARRLSREAYRLVSNSLKTGFDMVLLLYPGKDTGNACLDTRLEQLNALLSRAAVLQGK